MQWLRRWFSDVKGDRIHNKLDLHTIDHLSGKAVRLTDSETTRAIKVQRHLTRNTKVKGQRSNNNLKMDQ